MKKSSFGKITALTLAGSLCISALAMGGCAGNTANSSASSTAASSSSASASVATTGYKTFADDELLSGTHHVVMTVEGYEPITIELDADAAPQTVTNFVELVQNGYYDGKTFYRVVEDFCLQGGTLGNNAAGDDATLETIQGEFSENGVENALADEFDYGTVAMARTSLPNSATSTFFITLGDNKTVGASLDGKYAAFGTIDAAGMAIVEEIVNAALPKVDNAQMGSISDESSQPVITSIEFVD